MTAGSVACRGDRVFAPESGCDILKTGSSPYDCRQLGLDCDAASGICLAHDYGDIGQSCTSGCDSGFCLTGAGNLCTDFCCRQHDCPAGWVCRPRDDTTASGHTVDVCFPAPAAQGMARFGESCGAPADCRSGVCYQGICRESCCTDADCDPGVVPDSYCGFGGGDSPTACVPRPATGTDPLGSLGCATSGSPGDCLSNMCFTNYQPDTGCGTDGDCPATYPHCYDYPAGGTPNGVNDCVHDMCVGHCCSADDCPAPAASPDTYFCGKWVYSPGDVNVCLLHLGAATAGEGQACSANGECRSNFCAPSGVCRRRCCTDADCPSAAYPNCALEQHVVYGQVRQLNVCQ